jgi:hypothetical protein
MSYFFGTKSPSKEIASRNKILDEKLAYDIIPSGILLVIKMSMNIKHKHR